MASHPDSVRPLVDGEREDSDEVIQEVESHGKRPRHQDEAASEMGDDRDDPDERPRESERTP